MSTISINLNEQLKQNISHVYKQLEAIGALNRESGPKHKFRSYFKFGKITEKEKENLINFLINQHTHMRISPALWDWVNAPKFSSLQDYYFIDYDSETWLTMLSLIRPGAVRKTMQIIPAK